MKTRTADFRKRPLVLIKTALAAVLMCGYGLAHADCDNDGDNDVGAEAVSECGDFSPPPPTVAPPEAPPPDGCGAGDPVDCYTGIFIHKRRDLAIADVSALEVTRTYRSRDSAVRSFGIGTSLSYDIYLVSDGAVSSPATYIDLVQPDGGRARHLLGEPASYTMGAHYVANGTPSGSFGGSTIRSTGTNFVVTTKDGTRLTFAPYDGVNYRSSGLINSTDRYGNQTIFTRDTSGNLIKVTSPNGRHLFFHYDTSNRIDEAKDDSGRKVTYQYWPTGELKSATDPLGYVESYAYDSNHNMLSVTDKRGNVMVTNVYDPTTARVTQQTYAKGTAAEASASFAYTADSTGAITQTDFTDERGNVRRMTFNYNGYVTKRIEALGKPEQQTFTYTRDVFSNQVLTATDPLNHITQYAYDGNGNMLSRTVMLGTTSMATWRYTYDPTYNEQTSATDPLNHTNNFIPDALGSIHIIKDALGHTTTMEHDAQGRVTSITRQTGTKALTSNIKYNGADLLSITDPLLRQTTLQMDAVGRMIGARDPANQLYTFFYDGQDQITQRCDPQAHCANLKYDENGNLKQFVLGTTQRDFTYDERDRRHTEGRGSAVEVTLDYEPGGTIKTRTEASGRIQTATTFDGLGHVLHVDVKSGSPATVKRTRDWTWDALGRFKGLVDSVAGTVSYTYDDRFDALQSETSAAGTVNYTYYANGLRQSVTPSGGTAITYSYDVANRLQSVSQAAGTGSSQPASALNIGLTYDDANRRQTLTLANGVVLTYGWDDASQVTSLTWKQANGSALGDLAYGYDNLGRRTSMSGSLARTGIPPAVSMNVGTDGRISTESGVTLQYDANGRLTQDANYKYVWDELGQLSQVLKASDSSQLVSYAYDPVGRRTSQLGTSSAQVSAYLYDGANPIQIKRASGTENLLAGGVDEWFARTTGGQTQHFLSDALGSTLRLTDASGAKVVDYTYDPYGGSSNDNAAIANVFQYTGRENDGNGLYFHRARYRKPSGGRFISQDPIGLDGGENLSAYVGGNPIGVLDPLGLAPGAVKWLNPPRIPIPDPNGVVPGGPWEPNPQNKTGNYRGPKLPGGGRAQCQFVPDTANGGPPGAKDPYWKVNKPGTPGWQRYDLGGVPRLPGEVHAVPEVPDMVGPEYTEFELPEFVVPELLL